MLFDDEAYRAPGRPHAIPAGYTGRHRYHCAWCHRQASHVIVARPRGAGRPELLICQYCWAAGRRDWPPAPEEGEEQEP